MKSSISWIVHTHIRLSPRFLMLMRVSHPVSQTGSSLGTTALRPSHLPLRHSRSLLLRWLLLLLLLGASSLLPLHQQLQADSGASVPHPSPVVYQTGVYRNRVVTWRGESEEECGLEEVLHDWLCPTQRTQLWLLEAGEKGEGGSEWDV